MLFRSYKKKADVAKQFEEQALPVVSQVSGLLLANPTSAGNVLVAVRNSAELAQRTAKQMYELEPQFGDINAITKMSQSWAAISQSLEELIRASVDVEKQTAELTAQISEAKLRARAAQDAADTASAAAQRAMVGLPATGDPAFLRALADRERDTLLQQRYRSAATAIESSVARAADLRNANRVVADLQAKTTTGQPATNSAQLALSSFVTANLQQAVSQAAKDGDSAIAASRKFRNSALEGLVKTAPAIL